MQTPVAKALAGALLVLAGTAVPAAADPPAPLYVLVETAAQRLQTADPVAAFKWVNGGPITDSPRAQQILDAVAADAEGHQVDAGYVRRIFVDQIAATEGIEYTRFGQWKFDPASAPDTAPDLISSRAAIDNYNRAIVNEIALQWDSLHSPQCASELDAARLAVGAAHELDPLYRQALVAATRSYCPAI